ncbi:MAG: hypothetical protein RIQ79_1742 [Verrucomicrobiota bacterium]
MSQTTPETIVIRAEPIELSQLLKFAGIFGSGGEAKFAINSGEVTVNGAVELQARKKILGGQTVEIAGRTLLVKLGAAPAVKAKAAPKPAAKPVAKAAAQAKPAATGAPRAATKSFSKPAGEAAWAGEAKAVRTGQPGKPAAAGGYAKPAGGGVKPAARAKPVRDDDGYEDESPRGKPAASEASQRTFFYTELLKAQQAKRKKR